MLRALVFSVVLLGSTTWAQDELSEPPLVPAPETPEAPRGPPTMNPNADAAPPVTPQVGHIANRPLEPVPATAASQEEPPGRFKRIAWSLGFGAVSGAAIAVVGGVLGASVRGPQLQPMGNGWTGAALGFIVGAPIGVLIAGAIFDGNGAWWATVLGDLAGALVGLAAVGFGGAEGTPVLFSLPLVGSVLGYELTSVANRTVVTPTVSLLKGGGGSVGFVGVF